MDTKTLHQLMSSVASIESRYIIIKSMFANSARPTKRFQGYLDKKYQKLASDFGNLHSTNEQEYQIFASFCAGIAQADWKVVKLYFKSTGMAVPPEQMKPLLVSAATFMEPFLAPEP